MITCLLPGHTHSRALHDFHSDMYILIAVGRSSLTDNSKGRELCWFELSLELPVSFSQPINKCHIHSGTKQSMTWELAVAKRMYHGVLNCVWKIGHVQKSL